MTPSLALLLLACAHDADSNGIVEGAGRPTGASPTVWDDYRVETSATLHGVFASETGVYVAGTGGELRVGGRAGAWSTISVDVGEADFGGLWGEGEGADVRLAAVASSGHIARFENGIWVVADTGTSDHQAVSAADGTALYAVGWGGVYRFDGATWSEEPTPGRPRLDDVYTSDADASDAGATEGAVIAVGEGGVALWRRDGAWEAMDTGTEHGLFGVGGTSASDVWAVGEAGLVLHWDGAAWTPVEAPTDYALRACFVAASTLVYVVGDHGVAMRWNGAGWQDLPTGVTHNLYATHGASGNDVWAVGDQGMALRFKDG